MTGESYKTSQIYWTTASKSHTLYEDRPEEANRI